MQPTRHQKPIEERLMQVLTYIAWELAIIFAVIILSLIFHP